ncbi:MAG TPA: MFS transporter [Alphaproteobacteria bacterium]
MLAGVPARLINGAFLFYLAPLFLDALENSKPETARVMMIYAVMMAFSNPLWAKLVDRWRNPLPFVICGGLLSGLGMIVVWLRPDTWGVVAAITLLGIAQAFSMTSQITLVTQVTPRERQQLGSAAVLGMFRMIERAGSVAGPLVAAVLVGPYGYHGSMAITGLIVAGAAALLAITFMIAPLGRTLVAAPQPQPQRT